MSYTVHYLATNVGTSKKVGLSLIEKSKIYELDKQWKKQGKQYDHYHLKWNALKREQKKVILDLHNGAYQNKNNGEQELFLS